jgi:conserved domain protein
MTIGKTLWIVILIKLFIMFAVLKVFFFPDFLKEKSNAGHENEYVSKELLERSGK